MDIDCYRLASTQFSRCWTESLKTYSVHTFDLTRVGFINFYKADFDKHLRFEALIDAS